MISFFGLDPVIQMFSTRDYSPLNMLTGVLNIISPLIPLLLVIEIVRAFLMKRFRMKGYKISFFIIVFNRFVSRFISIGAVGFCIGFFDRYRIFTTTFSWYWLIYGYIVWELAHFVYHYLGHKVRLFWCLHSTHHAPEHMNLSVTYAHFFWKPLTQILSGHQFV